MMERTFGNYSAALFPEIQGQGFMPGGLLVRWVEADMVLGNPHAGCRGAGICKISVREQQSALSTCGCAYKPVLLTQVNENYVQLALCKLRLTLTERTKNFGSNVVAVHKIIPLAYPLRTALGYQTSVGVDVQNVEIHEDSFYYYLFMRVSNID